MTRQDLKKIIGTLRTEAVGRCRERIDQAACRAKDLMNGSKPDNPDERRSSSDQPYGMTSFLRKRHGL